MCASNILDIGELLKMLILNWKQCYCTFWAISWGSAGWSATALTPGIGPKPGGHGNSLKSIGLLALWFFIASWYCYKKYIYIRFSLFFFQCFRKYTFEMVQRNSYIF